jgi:hypothetical protein
MSSLIPDYNYDIFISYRQKDNKGDRWVSEFVDALKTELESTFKEEISVYFDINPRDGLLETHDVDASLKEKLRCLVFIPIISHTYCDPKSFAWEHEFKAFVELALQDKYGLKVRLPSGNVSSRVLPVRIYDLNKEDVNLCEFVLGGVLRGIEFIYKSAGVNRPLRANEDHAQENLNKTYYRDQINKMAHSIQEIIEGLRSYSIPEVKENELQKEQLTQLHRENVKKIIHSNIKLPGRKAIIFTMLALIMISVLVILYPLILNKKIFTEVNSSEILNKAISYCDFYHKWGNFQGKIRLRTVWENGNQSDETIEIQTKEDFYRSSIDFGYVRLIRGIKDGQCFQEINGNKSPSPEQIKYYGLDCSRIHYYKQHHYCHFGLLMELKTSGLTLQKKVKRVKFSGQECITLTFLNDTVKVKNEYFAGENCNVFLDPFNYTMKGIKWFGETNMYIVFSGILSVNDIKIPLCKTYFNSNDNSLKWIDVFSIAE